MKTDTNTKLTHINNLQRGDKFQIPSVRDTMRDMKFISTTETSSLIEGYKRDSVDESWRPFRMHVSNGVMVEVISEFDKDLMEENKQKATATAAQNEGSAPKRRGRPSKAKLAFNQLKGVDGEFTVKDVVEKGKPDFSEKFIRSMREEIFQESAWPKGGRFITGLAFKAGQ